MIDEVVANNCCCGKQRITFINDSFDGGSIFAIKGCMN